MTDDFSVQCWVLPKYKTIIFALTFTCKLNVGFFEINVHSRNTLYHIEHDRYDVILMENTTQRSSKDFLYWDFIHFRSLKLWSDSLKTRIDQGKENHWAIRTILQRIDVTLNKSIYTRMYAYVCDWIVLIFFTVSWWASPD
jgi:hypothetical protein